MIVQQAPKNALLIDTRRPPAVRDRPPQRRS